MDQCVTGAAVEPPSVLAAAVPVGCEGCVLVGRGSGLRSLMEYCSMWHVWH